MSRIYVIEDEVPISKVICLSLEAAGHEAVPAYTGTDVLEALYAGQHFDLAIVDIMLPGADGFELLEPLTKRGIPVIFLTARSDVDSRVRGLTEGADDYIVKPFLLPELMARVQKTLERYGRAETLLHIDDVEIDAGARTARRAGEDLPLTPREFDLLLLLARNRNIALTRDRILAHVWGQLFEGETRTVDAHISQLRKKTGLRIAAVPKVGYRLEETK